MSKYDWEEVKRLAADLQRAQLSSSSQKLSERNCVEIVTKLVQLKLVDVVFSNDGKSYITLKHLTKEILDELYVHDGRVNMIDVAKSLNVDLNVISSLSQDILKENPNIQVILGQLIDDKYTVYVAEEINERLQKHGLINVIELARHFDLPGDFIHTIINDHNGRILPHVKQDKQDLQLYYTDVFLNQNKAIIKGALTAITIPTQISTVIQQCEIEENIFFSLIDNLFECKQIPGIITERYSNICTYVPQIYLKNQSEWLNNFYKQNNYLEYDALSRVGINDPKSFITKCLPLDENIIYLHSCAIGPHISERIEACIEDIINSPAWINILNELPTVIDCDDAATIMQNIISRNHKLNSIRIFDRTYAVSHLFLNYIYTIINDKIINENASNAVDSGKYEQFIIESKLNDSLNNRDKRDLTRKEERKKRAVVGKSGGGVQGRETKTKSVKKKYGQKNANKNFSDDEDSKSNSNSVTLELVSVDELETIIKNDKSFLDEENDYTEFVDELVQYFYPLVNKAAIDLAHSLYEDKLRSISNTKRKMNSELQDNIVTVYLDFKLYLKGIKEFSDEDCQMLLSKYLLKTTGTQLVNYCFTFIYDKSDEINSAEGRLKVINTTEDKDVKEKLHDLHKNLNGNSTDDFLLSVESVLSLLNIMIKKLDKKKEKALLESHKRALTDKLQETDDPPLVLHLASLILFQTVTQCLLNASGRFVSNILNFLSTRLPEEIITQLQQYHTLVLNILKLKEEDDHTKITEELNKTTPFVKEIVFSQKMK